METKNISNAPDFTVVQLKLLRKKQAEEHTNHKGGGRQLNPFGLILYVSQYSSQGT
ncbi:hypothetical protein [Bacillus inaquosorum]|uniref:hypothetical protein n=1 Tax=Bacillus inaquosorum TaxID=483913 RepID=UPI003D164A97